jgi:hypothetical protein
MWHYFEELVDLSLSLKSHGTNPHNSIPSVEKHRPTSCGGKMPSGFVVSIATQETIPSTIASKAQRGFALFQ